MRKLNKKSLNENVGRKVQIFLKFDDSLFRLFFAHFVKEIGYFLHYNISKLDGAY